MSERLKGVAVPLVSPIDADGQIAASDLRRLIGSVRPHVKVLQPCLSSGEGWKLSDRQWRDVVSVTIEAAPELAIYPGILGQAASDPIQRARVAADLGAAGVTVKIPDLTALGPHRATQTLKDLAERCPLPLFLYNDQEIADEERMRALIDMCRLDNVAAIKESSRRPAVARRLADEGVPVSIFQGWEDCLQASGKIDGYALALANLEPALCATMLAAPDAQRQEQIVAVSQRYGLFEEEWFRGIKTELKRREVLETDRIV